MVMSHLIHQSKTLKLRHEFRWILWVLLINGCGYVFGCDNTDWPALVGVADGRGVARCDPMSCKRHCICNKNLIYVAKLINKIWTVIIMIVWGYFKLHINLPAVIYLVINFVAHRILELNYTKIK